MSLSSGVVDFSEGLVPVLFKSHFFAMCLFAIISGGVFACIMREKTKDRLIFWFLVALIMIGGAIAVGWLLYPFPR